MNSYTRIPLWQVGMDYSIWGTAFVKADHFDLMRRNGQPPS
jgi:hypothetical protein